MLVPRIALKHENVLRSIMFDVKLYHHVNAKYFYSYTTLIVVHVLDTKPNCIK